MATREVAIPVVRRETGLRLAASGWAERIGGWLRGLGYAAPARNAPLRVEARISLGAKKSLVLVQCCGRKVLLGVSGDAIAPVLEIGMEAAAGGAGSQATRRASTRSTAKGAAR